MRKAIIILILAISITFMVNVKAYAEEEPSATPTPTAMPNPYSKLIIRSDGSVNINNVYDAYFNLLTNDQQDLCNYLIGLSNYMYLTARGFTYETVTTGEELISMLCAFGYRFWQVVPDEFSSRLTPYMQNYIAACVTYSAQQDNINGALGTWIDNHSEDLYIPYSDNALVGWTAFYNDPSSLGVKNWGNYETDWVSGTYFDFMFSEYEFNSANDVNTYNNYILNYSPVLYSNISGTQQHVMTLNEIEPFDSLYILRTGTDVYYQYRFGYVGEVSSNITFSELYVILSNRNKLSCGNTTGTLHGDIYTFNTEKSLVDVIEYAFNSTPYAPSTSVNLSNWIYYDCYPYISHVYLVDDLDTLENMEEIYDNYSLGINNDNAKWIKTPKGEVLYYPIGTGATLVEFPLPEYLKKDDGNGNLISIDPTQDLSQEIVNNTVINNYDIIAPGVIINVPVDWFDSEGNYLDYTYNYSLPFFAFVGDVFLSLGEIRVFLLAALILLICGGVIGKFLL